MLNCITILCFWSFLFSSMLQTSTSLDTMAPSQSIIDGETLISHGRTFELGFFSPGNSKSRYVGIWYFNISPLTVVWVANRETPLNTTSGVLRLTDQGLVLVNATNSTVWFSNMSSTARNPIAQLLGTGNLVVKDGNDEKHLWQSFDYPGDTLLPGMQVGRNLVTGLERFLSSWRSADDPDHGDYVLKVDIRGYPQAVLLKGTTISTRLWLRSRNVFIKALFLNEKEIVLEFGKENIPDFIRYVVTPWGYMQLFHWTSETRRWDLLLTRPAASCDNYAFCGANSICDNKQTPVCACLKGFVPKHPAERSATYWSNGCVRITPLSCSKDGFKKYTGMFLPDTSSSWYNKRTMVLQECEDLCRRNCSCTAYANLDINDAGSGCILWFHDLIDMRQTFKVQLGHDLYVRVLASELDHSQKTRNNEFSKKLVGIMLGSFIMCIILGLAICVCKNKSEKPGILKIICWKDCINRKEMRDIDIPTFDLSTIFYCTNGFSSRNKLGEGGFGPVYKGVLANGTEIAVKRLSKSSEQGLHEFKTEVQLIAKLQHRNLVKLLGCCIQQKEKLLIYEFMPNKSLDYFIFDDGRRKLLDWTKRFQIISGTARGLVYLHQDSRLRIIHRDLKTSNILLDNGMNPKISDFGLARTFWGDQVEANTKTIVGTHGYISPEYAAYGSFSMKSDVYSFVVIVLEVVSGRKNRELCVPNQHLNLLGYAWKLWSEGRSFELVEESMCNSVAESQVLRCIHIGLLCVQERPEDRPNMSCVIHMLNDDKSLPGPRQPAFYPRQDGSTSTPLKSEVCSRNDVSITLLEPR